MDLTNKLVRDELFMNMMIKSYLILRKRNLSDNEILDSILQHDIESDRPDDGYREWFRNELFPKIVEKGQEYLKMENDGR